MKVNVKRRQAGFTALEVLVALIIVSAVIAGVPRMYARWFEQQATTVAAEHMRIVADAAAAYIKDNYSVVAANATPAAPAIITTAMMRTTGHLQQSFGDLNAYGQSYRVLVLQPVSNKLQTLIVTEGGETIAELSLRAIAKQIGAEGGYISKENTSLAEGSFAGWQTQLAPYGVTPGAGHLATALFFQDGALVNDYLYRHPVPGKPELQRMNASIDMNKNNVDNAGNVNAETLTSGGRTEVGEFLQIKGVQVANASCPQDGLVSRTQKGTLLTCQGGVWKSATSGGNWGGSFFYSPGHGGCYIANPLTKNCSCPTEYTSYYAYGIEVGGCFPCVLYQCAKPD